MNKQELSRTFVVAANVLIVQGVAAGTREDDNGRVCALGALGVVLADDPWHNPERDINQALVDALGLHYVSDPYNRVPYGEHADADDIIAAWSNNLVDKGDPDAVIKGFVKAAAHYAV